MLAAAMRRTLRGAGLAAARGYCGVAHPESLLFLKKHARIGSVVTARGWVRSVREQKLRRFIEINDGSCFSGIQVVASEVPERLTTGCSVAITGRLVEMPGKAGAVPKRREADDDSEYDEEERPPCEIHAESVQVIGECDASQYPLQKKKHSLEFMRGMLHLRPRSNTFGAVARMRNACMHQLHAFFQLRGFLQITTPILTSSDCEGAGEVFSVLPDMDVAALKAKLPKLARKPEAAAAELEDTLRRFFRTNAHLTVSGQLQAEMFASALSRVYVLGPTFRAETSTTKRHLSEFWMLEPEVAFATLDDVVQLAEECVRHVCEGVLLTCEEDLEFFNKRVDTSLLQRLQKMAQEPFQRMTYTEAVRELKKSGQEFAYPVEWGCSLQTEHERWLADTLCQGTPVFVTHYPAGIKPFYMRASEQREAEGDTVEAMDLLVPRMGELIGGSAREHDYNVLKARMEAAGLLGDPETDLQWYLDLRRFGSVPHAGWGMGFERLMMMVTGLDNIRDVIPVPRAMGTCKM